MGNSFGFGPPPDVSVRYESYGERLGKSLCGVCVGVVLFMAMVILLGWNEFNYVNNANIIMYVSGNTIEAGCTSESANSGKPVWVSCPVSSLYNFSKDDRLNIQGSPLQVVDSSDLISAWLEMSSQMFVWNEDKQCSSQSDGHGGKRTVCRYTYYKSWSSSVPDSSQFHCVQTATCRCGYTSYSQPCRNARSGEAIGNYDKIPSILQRKYSAPDNKVSIGKTFGLNSGMISQLASSRPLNVIQGAARSIPGIVPGKNLARSVGSGVVQFYSDPYGGDSVGDVRTTFTKSRVTEQVSTLSAIAMQTSSGASESLTPWNTGKPGTMSTVNWVYEGVLSKKGFIDMMASENSSYTWITRLVGWLLMWLSLQLITGPIALVPQAVPCIGGLIGEVVGCALCCVNFAVSVSFSMFIIGIAWLLARPLIGGIFLVAAFVISFGGLFFARSVRSKRGARAVNVDPLMPTDAIPTDPMRAGAGQSLQPQAAPAQQMQVLVPPGVVGGQMIQVQAPDGRLCNVVVPQGLSAGQPFMVSV